jgi:guanosine-3',5'-bis(diphosphate) 3'-pyrophosphohydrolase
MKLDHPSAIDMRPSTSADVGLILEATAFAARKHRDQRRKDKEESPYVNHPIALANVLWNEGAVYEPIVIAAALLHDTIEDTRTEPAELVAVFGEEVAAIVAEVTDDKTLSPATRKELQIQHAPHLSRAAKLVKLADKICNVREVDSTPPADWSLHRRQEYFDWAKAVVDGLRGVHPELERRFDEAFAARPR